MVVAGWKVEEMVVVAGRNGRQGGCEFVITCKVNKEKVKSKKKVKSKIIKNINININIYKLIN
jgi:hypothetical protein